ncbi:uncharacterized protein BYT42DRAFT_582068 [Radiomyces spectabilis]|uniref:uncharacterized protein n=1 Tax=Radiomyces spectabilis TaxID=64574 RepID=UPI0022206C42|nr:uncharacterized protein BYT42DRAFT_582068 [Radiomyces spectabilis]KAI8370364.1 hypothetical protein BYT42DRAFT_582068 [Radiomyces spectabilis]
MQKARFRRIFGEGDYPVYTEEQLALIVDELPFILEFFEQLLKKLQSCQSVDECAAKYSYIGPMLTRATMHPFISYSSDMVRLLVACLMEYTKFNTTTNTASKTQQKACLWCLQRLRCLFSRSGVARDQQLIHPSTIADSTLQQVHNVQMMLNTLTEDENCAPNVIRQLLDTCLFLDDEQAAGVLIDQLVIYALELMDRTLDDPVTPRKEPSCQHLSSSAIVSSPPISKQFIDQLVMSAANRRNLLWQRYQSWPVELKRRLWRRFDDLLAMELMDIIEHAIIETDYISLDHLYVHISNNSFVQQLEHQPHLSEKVFSIATNWTVEIEDWRTIRFCQCLYKVLQQYDAKFDESKSTSTPIRHIPNDLAPLLDLLDLISMKDHSFGQICANIHKWSKCYIYTARFDEITPRLNTVWATIMLFPTFIQSCTLYLINWCMNSTASWEQDEHNTLRLLAWLMYPSDDFSLQRAMNDIKSWLFSLKNNQHPSLADTIDMFMMVHHDLFAGNLVISISFLLSILGLASEWPVNSCFVSIDRFVELRHAIKEEFPNMTTLTFNSPASQTTEGIPKQQQSYHPASLYLLLDILDRYVSEKGLLLPFGSVADRFLLFFDHVNNIVQQQSS